MLCLEPYFPSCLVAALSPGAPPGSLEALNVAVEVAGASFAEQVGDLQRRDGPVRFFASCVASGGTPRRFCREARGGREDKFINARAA